MPIDVIINCIYHLTLLKKCWGGSQTQRKNVISEIWRWKSASNDDNNDEEKWDCLPCLNGYN